MKCPYCDFEGAPRGLHAHLGDAHPEVVQFFERGDKSFYGIECPVCGAGYDHQIKPRGRDPGFVDEYSAQIRLVAFDMLVNHLLAEHEEIDLPEEAAAPAEPEGPVAAGPGPAWLVEARRRAASDSDGPGENDASA